MTVIAVVLALAATAVTAILATTRRHRRAVDGQLRRVEDYANGARRLLLLAASPAADTDWLWTARVQPDAVLEHPRPARPDLPAL